MYASMYVYIYIYMCTYMPVGDAVQLLLRLEPVQVPPMAADTDVGVPYVYVTTCLYYIIV